jgi:phosphatidylserine/phosphatidylglycerophosphate/cardiolipin synthase-like enzyme
MYVQLCYIHSKVMIVDDRRVICGSANLNDRSQVGDHDSEIAIVIEDQDMVESVMDGKKYMASRLATTWRRTLMRGKLRRSFRWIVTRHYMCMSKSDGMQLTPIHRTPRPPSASASVGSRQPTNTRHAPCTRAA